MKRRFIILVVVAILPLFGLLNILAVCFAGSGDVATSLTSGPAVVMCLDGDEHALFSSFAPSRAKSFPAGDATSAWSAPRSRVGPEENFRFSLARPARDGHPAAVSLYQLNSVYLI
jgi:hypothetical protein